MTDDVPQFEPIGLDELPEWLPRPEAPIGVEVAWFYGRRELNPLEDLELYVWRAGDGGRPPFRVTVLACSRPAGMFAKRSDPGVACWPALEDVWSAIDATCLDGAMFQLPAHLAGERFRVKLEGQVVAIVATSQVGAIAGSAAFARWALSNPAKLVQGMQ